jgi:hypothetical protein
MIECIAKLLRIQRRPNSLHFLQAILEKKSGHIICRYMSFGKRTYICSARVSKRTHGRVRPDFQLRSHFHGYRYQSISDFPCVFGCEVFRKTARHEVKVELFNPETCIFKRAFLVFWGEERWMGKRLEGRGEGGLIYVSVVGNGMRVRARLDSHV